MDDNLPTFYINCYNCLQIVFCVQILGYYCSMQEPIVCHNIEQIISSCNIKSLKDLSMQVK